MSQSEFLKSCSREPENIRSDGAYNPDYNTWELSCLKALLPKYKEYPELLSEIEELVKREEASTIPVTKEKTVETYSRGTAAGIGAASATGGAVLGGSAVAGLPVLIKWLFGKFS